MKRLEAHKFTESFREYWGNKDRSLGIEEYEFCLNEWQSAHNGKMMRHYVIAIILFSLGLWALYEHAIVGAVLLLAFAANSNRQSSTHMLLSEVMDTQRLLAMQINGQRRELIEIREILVKATGG